MWRWIAGAANLVALVVTLHQWIDGTESVADERNVGEDIRLTEDLIRGIKEDYSEELWYWEGKLRELKAEQAVQPESEG